MYCIVLIVGVIQLPESTDRRSAADLYMCLPAIFSAKLARQEQARVCIELFNDTATTEIYTSLSSAASDVYKRQYQYQYTTYVCRCSSSTSASSTSLHILISVLVGHIPDGVTVAEVKS